MKHSSRSLGQLALAALAALGLELSLLQAQAAAWTTNSPMAAPRYGHTVTLLPNGKLLAAGGYTTNLFIPSVSAATELYDPATGKWSATGAMHTNRCYHTATLLPNGRVLVVGGNGSLASAELYDPATGTWTTTGALATGRQYHTATLLPDGRVLVVGGQTNSTAQPPTPVALASAELYSPATGQWTAAGAMSYARGEHTATLLTNGQVLIAGGSGAYGVSSTAELYDPAAGTWTLTGTLQAARAAHTTTLLPNGKVLAVGGTSSFLPPGPSAELYDPATGTWTGTGELNTNRFGHGATLLPNGKVLVTGGYGSSTSGVVRGTEVYDPATGLWTAAGNLVKARHLHTATLLPNGKLLVVGGQGSLVANDALSSVEQYDPASGACAAAGTLATARYWHTATLLPNGRVLVAGGYAANQSILASAELYDPAAGTWTATGSMNSNRTEHTATLLPTGKVLVTGGSGSGGSSAELYDPQTGLWSRTGRMGTARYWHTATLLPNGKVLAAGGSGTAGTELYDPASGTWTPTGPLNTVRNSHTATLLPNGKVLITGGQGTGGALSSAELYDPASGAWTFTAAVSVGVYGHTATLLPNGKVLVPAIAQVYDPATGTWSATGSLQTSFTWGPTATLLPNGKVLLAGISSLSLSSSAQLYDPATGTWSLTGPPITKRQWHTATLLLNGKVLFASGTTNNVAPFVTTSAEVYDTGLGAITAAQPQIATCTSPLALAGSLNLGGSGFRGLSEGSAGNSQDSPADFPLVQLRSLEGGRSLFLPPTGWQADSFTSAPVWGFPPGYAVATVFVNGIPSMGAVVNVSVPVPTPATLTGATILTNGAFQCCFTNSVGALFGVLGATNPALPLSNWTPLGGVTEVAPGQFQFTDPQATNTPRRFYRIGSP